MKRFLAIVATMTVMAIGLVSVAAAGGDGALQRGVTDFVTTEQASIPAAISGKAVVVVAQAEAARKAAEEAASQQAAAEEAASQQAAAEAEANAQAEAVVASEEGDAWSILAGYGLEGVSISFGETYGYEAIAYYKSGRIVISPTHTVSLSTLIAHEVQHIIAYRESGKTTEF